MDPNTLRAEFEATVPIRETERKPYWSGGQYELNGKGKWKMPAPSWEWQDNHQAWHTGFDTREAAYRDAVHALLCKAQEYGQPEHYARLMLLAWTMPLPVKYLQTWEAFRPAPKRVTPKIPDACRAPAQALAWGMDPELVRTAKARRAVADLASSERTPGRGNHWKYRLAGRMHDSDFKPTSAFMMDLSRVLREIRRQGLAEAFGVWTEPEPAQPTDTAAHA
jgi:hypothetical protein